jgi:N-dimethylarginine dimethylaminohydrolase
MWPKHVVMISPDFFEIAYAINPHMVESSGNLKKINPILAQEQWTALKNKFTELGIEVSVFQGISQLPDMVFCANPLLPFKQNNRMNFIASNMSSNFRRNEVEHLAQWANENNYEVYKLPDSIRFEGMGDAIWNYETEELFGGYGFRTEKQAYNEIEEIIRKPVVRLQLVSETFYHLDTALCIIDKNTAVVVKEAFSDESLDKLRMKFKNIVYAPADEAQKYLAANACSVDGKNILIEKNAIGLQKQLSQLGYITHPIDTSEYIKSGGSIFCMKLQVWDKLSALPLNFAPEWYTF